MTVAKVPNDPKSDDRSLFIPWDNHHEQVGNDCHQHDMYDVEAIEVYLDQNAKNSHVKMPYDSSM